MTLQVKTKKTFARFLRDTAGNFGIIWALSGTAAIFAVGSAYDVNQVSKAKKIAQMAADNMALVASVAVDFDNAEKFVEGRPYNYNKLGGPSKDFTNSITGVVTYDVIDEQDQKKDSNGDPVFDETGAPVYEKLIARAVVKGTYQPAFMSAIGVDGVDFEASSDVAYAARKGKPASIFFVPDNSGSMRRWDDNYVRKINSLKSSMTSFMQTLGSIPSNGNTQIFRTALFPYNSDLIYGKTVDPKWNVLTNNSINLMDARGGTRSTNALSRAKSKFNLENNIHDNENGDNDPLKFLVFMSDGANNGVTYRNVCQDESVWVPGGRERWVLHWYGSNYTYYSYSWWFAYYNVTHYPASGGGYETQEVCHQEQYSPVNEASLEHCTYMKNQGVKIYSIAYDVSSSERAMAEEFMKECSSGVTDYYKYATDGADLQAVFDEIGQAVLTEVIRIKR